jgi:ABC-type nickel/cobalt efflux system permease component RcnA
MWGTLFKQASRLAQEGYSREEVKEILKRAAELQAQAENEEQAQQQGQINRDALRAGAMAAGIRPEFLEQALQEFHARRQAGRQGQQQREKWGKWLGLTLAAIFGLPIALFVLGTLAFTFGVTFFVLLAVGLALGVAGLALLLASPFVGFGLLIGLAAMVGHMLGRMKGQKRRWRKGRWQRWFEDDDDD